MQVVDLDKIDDGNVPGEEEQLKLTDIVTEEGIRRPEWIMIYLDE